MLKAYLDESGHSSDPRCHFVGMGALVATSEKWEEFTVAWKAALDEFIGGAPFHMKDYICIPPIGPYVGWDELKRQAFLKRLIDAIVISNAQFIGCVVSMEGFAKLLPEHQAVLLDPYYLSFQHVTHGCRISGMTLSEVELFAGEQVAMIYAYQADFGTIESGRTDSQQQGRAEQLWHAMKAQVGPFSKFMGSYASALAADVAALQAADLFAYEITKEFENRLNRPNDKMRWGLRQLFANSDQQPLIIFYGFETLLENLMDGGHIAENTDIRIASSMLQLGVKMDMEGRYSNDRTAKIQRRDEEDS